LAISDIRIFGNSDERLPDPPVDFSVRRETDRRNALVQWKAIPGAVGYNVRWGIRKERLYETYQVFADSGTRLEIRALTAEQEYYFAVEAFNETGVSRPSEVMACP
jgi:xylan 1,4-beta-xylosidase